MTNIFNELLNADRFMTGTFNEKDFWSAQCMQCTSRFTTKNFNDSRQFIKFKRSLLFQVYSTIVYNYDDSVSSIWTSGVDAFLTATLRLYCVYRSVCNCVHMIIVS